VACLGLVVAGLAASAAAQTVELVSKSTTAGQSAYGDSHSWSVSRDGRWVVFMSGAKDLLSGITYPAASLNNVFLLDRESGTTTLVSHAHDNPAQAGNYSSSWGAISADGNWIVFESRATDLVTGGTPGLRGITWQVYLRNRVTGKTGLVSRSITSPTQGGAGEAAPMGVCSGPRNLAGYSVPTISSDGSRIAFISCAYDLVANTIPVWNQFLEQPHAYVFTKTSDGDSGTPPEGTLALVDPAIGGPPSSGDFAGDPRSNGGVRSARVSGNGQWVAYETSGTDILAGNYDVNGQKTDVFLYQVDTGQQTLLSESWQVPGTTADDESASANHGWDGVPISDDGRWIAFSSLASDLIQNQVNPYLPGAGPARQTWLFDRDTRSLRMVTHKHGSTVEGVATRSYARTSMSADGRYLAFQADAKDLLPAGATNNYYFVLLFDRVTGTTAMVSGDSAAGIDCTDFTLGGSGSPHISPDGSRVAFASLCRQGLDPSTEYASWPDPAAWQVYSWDRATGAHTLVTRKASYPDIVVFTEWGGTLPAFGQVMSNAGDVLAFGSLSTETVNGFADGNDSPLAGSLKVSEDVFLWTVPPPPTLTVAIVGSGSVASNPAGIACPGDCSEIYALNTAVTLTPSPAAGWMFEAWSGDCSPAGQVSMSGPKACTATFARIPPADLSVAGQATPNPVPAGGTTLVTFGVQNLGPASATSVVATFVPPAKGTVTLAPGCVKGKGKGAAITCALGTMASGESRSLQFSIGFRRSVTGTFTTSLSVASTTPDNVPGNNAALVQFSIGQ
jgi:Tol biopolymer transport system component